MSPPPPSEVSADLPLKGKTVSLVLGSGAARGLAHIGVIRQLLAAGLEIKAIAGSSMGALIGGIHAAGAMEDYAEWVSKLDRTDVLSMADWTLSGGLIRGRKIINKLEALTGDVQIESLPVAFTAVVVDLDLGRELWLDRGRLFDAIRASIAIPGIFTPHNYRGRTLVDGGLLNPVPVAPTLRCVTDFTIVVDVNGPSQYPSPLATNRHNNDATDDEPSMMDRIREWMDSFGNKEDAPSNGSIAQPGLLATMSRSLDIMQAALTRHHLALFTPDLVIAVPKNICMVHEFYRAKEIIALGEQLTQQALSEFTPSNEVWRD
jgi:NTE family protein